jgi:hypothetical protein
MTSRPIFLRFPKVPLDAEQRGNSVAQATISGWQKHLGYAVLCALLPAWKKEFPWLSDVPAQALPPSLKDLERAYTNFFGEACGLPLPSIRMKRFVPHSTGI